MEKEVLLYPPADGVQGTVYLPGSKSITNRALIAAALAAGKSTLKNISLSDDSLIMSEALKKLGVRFTASNEIRQIDVSGTEKFESAPTEINVGAAGTAARFLTALLAATSGQDCSLVGDKRMSERPIAPLVDALRSLGAEIEYLDKTGSLPLHIKGKELTGGSVEIDGSVSSQFITALLLIAPLMAEGLELNILGELVSRSYIDLTIAVMHEFGVEVENCAYHKFVVKPKQRYQAQEYVIEGDASGASYYLGLAALSGGTVKVYNLDIASPQADARFAELLGEMGCCYIHGSDLQGKWIAVSGHDPLYAIQADMSLMPDTAQTLAVLAAAAEGTTKIKGLSTLRNKETDRIRALLEQLNVLGIKAEYDEEVLTIHGGKPQAALIQTYNDHRMALAFAMLGGKFNNIRIAEPDVVNKSVPDFWQEIQVLGVKLG